MGGGIGQGELDRLFSAALEAAVARLEKDGHFFPLIFELRTDGTIQAIAMLETGTVEGDAVIRMFDVLRQRGEEGLIRGAAIACHESGGSEVEVHLRAPNYASNIIVPFTVTTRGFFRRKRELTLGEFSARQAQNEVFPAD
ncbi:hypothetical protein [Qipengyuania sp. RANM35]|uniref:hypothetical protein n=1 Tax=Qipengyuania sp. RANM35 TaxID=3068635 RepID=UPI0034DB2479